MRQDRFPLGDSRAAARETAVDGARHRCHPAIAPGPNTLFAAFVRQAQVFVGIADTKLTPVFSATGLGRNRTVRFSGVPSPEQTSRLRPNYATPDRQRAQERTFGLAPILVIQGAADVPP